MSLLWKTVLSVLIFIGRPAFSSHPIGGVLDTPGPYAALNTADSLIKAYQIDSAIALYTSLSAQVPKHSVEAARVFIGLGQGYLLNNRLDTALVHLHNALTNLKSHPQEKSLCADAYSATGVVHAKMKNFDAATDYFNNALMLLEAPDVNRLKVLVNLGGVYLDQGIGLAAKSTLTEALTLAHTQNILSIAAIIHTNLSNLYINLEDWSLAEIHAQQGLNIRDSLGDASSATTLNNLGYARVKLGKTKQGIEHYQAALQLASPPERTQLLDNLQQAHTEAGNFQQANKYLMQLLRLKDSLYQVNLDEKIATINTVYETAEKQQQINNLRTTNELRETQLWYLAIAATLLLIGVGMFMKFRLRHVRMKQALEQSQLKQRLLQAQLNPHFIFNAMNRVQHFIYAHDVEKSTAYLRDFATLTRLTLESSDNAYVSLAAEVDMLTHYLRLQQLGSDPPFKFSIEVEPNVDIDGISIPVMLIQPFVENAVIHGVKGREGGTITVSIKQADLHLLIAICDNGPGITYTPPQKPTKRRAFGMNIIDQRIYEYNKANKLYITKTVQPAREHPEYPGTCISLSIPI